MAKKGNPRIKRANEVVEMTPTQVRELYLCSEDVVYFIENYIKVQHPTKGSIPLKLYDYQKKMLHDYQHFRYNIVLSARQTGKSIISAVYLFWYSIFHDDKTILIASNKNSGAMEMIHRIRFAYEELPMWLKPGVQDDGWNKHSVSFDNKSRIISTATSPDSGRGLSISLLFLDEFAFVAPNIQDEFWSSISPTLSTGGSCIITSTPNGDSNRFARMWRAAEVGATLRTDELKIGFNPIRVKWDEPPGRDEKFKEEQIAILGKHMWEQEYECVTGDSSIDVQWPTGTTEKLTINQLKQLFEDSERFGL